MDHAVPAPPKDCGPFLSISLLNQAMCLCGDLRPAQGPTVYPDRDGEASFWVPINDPTEVLWLPENSPLLQVIYGDLE